MSVYPLISLIGGPSSPLHVRPAVGCQIWMGKVVDPEPRYPRTISMTWVDPCEMEVRTPVGPMGYRSSFGMCLFRAVRSESRNG